MAATIGAATRTAEGAWRPMISTVKLRDFSWNFYWNTLFHSKNVANKVLTGNLQVVIMILLLYIVYCTTCHEFKNTHLSLSCKHSFTQLETNVWSIVHRYPSSQNETCSKASSQHNSEHLNRLAAGLLFGSLEELMFAITAPIIYYLSIYYFFCLFKTRPFHWSSRARIPLQANTIAKKVGGDCCKRWSQFITKTYTTMSQQMSPYRMRPWW